MSYIQASYRLAGCKAASPPLSQSFRLHTPCSYSFPVRALARANGLPGFACRLVRGQGSPTCLLGGKDKYGDGKEALPQNAIEQAARIFGQGRSVHDILTKQMEEREFGGGGGSGRRFGGDSSGGSGDENGDFSAQLNELLQVVLATLSFTLVYTFLIRREELTRLSGDYIRYLRGGKPSPRLRRVMGAWGTFFDRIKGKKTEADSGDTADSSPAW